MPNDSDRPAIGIDVGGTNMAAGLVLADGKIDTRFRVDTEADQGADHVVERVADCIKGLLDEANLKPKDIVGVGLGIPGAVDVASGVVLEAVNLRWRDLNVVKALGKMIDAPVTLDNDVNVGAWGEFQMGAGRGARSLLAVFIGTGIGGGFVIDGKLYHGPYGTAGEIGHTIVNATAPYGSRTLERLASRTAIVNRLNALMAQNVPSSLPEHAGKKWPQVRSKAIARAVAANDELTLRVVRDAAHAVAVACANAVTLLSIDCVVLGGGLTEALDERWLHWVRASFNDAVFPDVCKQCRLAASELGDDAGLLGAALLARQRLG